MPRIAVVGSPSTTRSITIDILGETEQQSLHGDLVYLAHPMGDDGFLIALGTVTEIKTSNRWHEDANMRGVLKQHGTLPHLSEVGDVRAGEVLIQAAYEAESADPAIGDPPQESGGALSMSPTTGSSVYRVTDEFLKALVRRHEERIIYLGHIYRSSVRMPLLLRHFDASSRGGAGEAFHTGVFGMSGSGKSGFASYLIAAQLRHREMGVIIVDPQGQFSNEQGLPFPLQNWAKQLGRRVRRYAISRNLRLPKNAFLLVDLLKLTPLFKSHLGIRGSENRESAVHEFRRIVQGTQNWNTRAADEVLRQVLQTFEQDGPALSRIYSSSQSRSRLTGALQVMLQDQTQFDIILEVFRPIHSLFAPTNLQGERRVGLHVILKEIIDRSDDAHRPLVIIDFSRQEAVGESAADLLESTPVKARLLRMVCSAINVRAERAFREGKSLNLSIVFDEAQRFAAQDPEDDGVNALASRLVDYVRTTRKLGIGWMFITQEVSSLKRSIYRQLRVRCFGYGLTSGSEMQRLRETVGDDAALELYRSFVDPEAVQPSRFPFMVTGPVSPLSFTGAPIFLSVYTDFQEFLRDNGYERSVEDGRDLGDSSSPVNLQKHNSGNTSQSIVPDALAQIRLPGPVPRSSFQTSVRQPALCTRMDTLSPSSCDGSHPWFSSMARCPSKRRKLYRLQFPLPPFEGPPVSMRALDLAVSLAPDVGVAPESRRVARVRAQTALRVAGLHTLQQLSASVVQTQDAHVVRPRMRNVVLSEISRSQISLVGTEAHEGLKIVVYGFLQTLCPSSSSPLTRMRAASRRPNLGTFFERFPKIAILEYSL